MFKQLTSVVFLLATFFIAGCDVKNEPFPLTDLPLVGIWEAEQRIEENGLLEVQRMYVEFTEEGYIAFHRVNCWTELGSETHQWKMKNFAIDFMPITKLTKVKIKAQWMPLTPTLEMKIDSWPEQKNGVTTMSIDGMELIAKPEASDRSQWQCETMANEIK